VPHLKTQEKETAMTTMMSFETVPVLPAAVRNIVIARAAAGSHDPTETPHKAIDACRRAARERLHVLRLNPAQAAAVDALVIETRVAAHMRGSFSVEGRTMVLEPRPTTLSERVEEDRDDTMKAILAVLLRFERLFVAAFALLFRRRVDASETVEATPAFAPVQVRQLGAGGAGRN